MPRFLEGHLNASGLKFGIIVSRFNDFITEKLLGGAVDALVRSGADEQDIDVARVPGAWEIPLAAKKMAGSGKYDAVICLGAVIRGSTPHFDYVAAEVSKGVAVVGLETGVPIAFGGDHHGYHRTGDRASRDQGREQGAGRGRVRRGNG